MRELVVLGTASQAPTRTRAHNACFLRWDADGILFDPGEGTQRQMLLAGIPHSAITRICITHLHGDHCLGLPGVIQRLSLDRVAHPVHLHFPASGLPYIERLRQASLFEDVTDLRLHPVEPGCLDTDPVVDAGAAFRLEAAPLRHRVDTIGWRLVEPDDRRMLPERLAAAGVAGPDVGRLIADGTIESARGTVRLEEVSEPRRGQRAAFVMDTSPCEGAERLADGADLLVCESTFLAPEAHLAEPFGHLTAAQAGGLAASAGARRLVLTHFSQRYTDEEDFAAEARLAFPKVVAARDLTRVPVPKRRP